MKIAFEIILAVILIAAGYAYACFYLNNEKLGDKNFAVLKPNACKIFYLAFAAISVAVLVYLFETVYMLSLLQSIKLLSLVLIMFPMAAIDLRLQKIPNKLILFALALRAVLYIPEFLISRERAFATLKDNLLAAIIIGGFFLLLLLIFKNSIGMGDIKLFAVMGMYQGVWGTVNSVFFSLTVSFVISVLLLITRKKSRKDTISFGPSILVGTMIAIGLAGM